MEERRMEKKGPIGPERRIHELIEEAEDPVQRATLLILSRIDVALEANTQATERIASSVVAVDAKLVGHIHTVSNVMSAVKGGQYVGAFLLSALLLLGGYILNRYATQVDRQEQSLLIIDRQLASLVQMIHINDKRLDAIERSLREHEAAERARVK
jgi:hypothetical protein